MSQDRTTSRLRALALGVACAVPLVAASPASAATCSKPNSPKYPGQGYYTTLKAFGISCSGAKDVMHAHYKCRTRNGIKGKCASFNGWKCSEKRVTISTEYNSRVTCRKGGRKVVYTYNQDT